VATGIGAWDEEDFVRAMRRGKSPDRSLWPAFPFPFFTEMTEADLSDVWAFLRTVEPVVQDDIPHDLKPGGLARWGYHTFAFSPRRFKPPTGDPVLDRGAYLVGVVGHCEGCHSPRNAFGNPSNRHAFAGAEGPPYDTPNLTPHADGLAAWTVSDWTWFLESGLLPDGDAVGGGMGHVVREGTSRLTPEDRAAIAAWMMALPPEPSPEDDAE
jgi:mono/diheme cytochrome c family protein